jgi:chromosome segregation ATPase
MPAEPVLSRVSSIAALVRDVGVILGIPVVLTVGIKLYDLQTKALEAQMKAVEAQNEVLKQTQYDRALAMIKSQRELFENERASLEKQVINLSTSDKDKSQEIAQLQKRIADLDVFKRRVDKQDANLQQIMTMLMLQMSSEKSGGKSPPPPPPPPPLDEAGRSVTVKIRK